MTDKDLKIVIVDDHPIFRMGLVRSLEDEPGMTIVGEGASADDAIQLYRELKPDVILLDLSMPGSGYSAITSILSFHAQAVIVVLTASERESDIFEAMKLGARAYVLKGVEASELVNVMRAALEGGLFVSRPMASEALEAFDRKAIPQPQENAVAFTPADLTAREQQILELVADGNSNKEVARILNLQEKSVKHVMTRVLRKLHARNRTEAAKFWRDFYHKE